LKADNDWRDEFDESRAERAESVPPARRPNCPSLPEWGRYAAGVLPEEYCAEMIAHAADCSACAEMLASLADSDPLEPVGAARRDVARKLRMRLGFFFQRATARM
jgi:hypothetical protein